MNVISEHLEWCAIHKPDVFGGPSEESALVDCWLTPSDAVRYLSYYSDYMMFVLLVAQDIKTRRSIVSASKQPHSENAP